MMEGVSEIAAMCVGLIGLIGASATTVLPMWKVTVSPGGNKTDMEMRWEGLWMSCHREPNIRMQCVVYDSMFYLSPELHAGRGLMCCSVALSGLGLLVALAGMKCTSCFQGIKWAKTVILMVAGGIQYMACICVFLPVSWTGHVIVRDLNDPPLDTHRRKLGEALYLGWVTATFLFASALLFTCRCLPSDNKPSGKSYSHVSSLSSTRNSHRSKTTDANLPLQNVAEEMKAGEACMDQSAGSSEPGSIHIPESSMYVTQDTAPYNGLCDPMAYNCYY
ncbi:claudin-8 [Fundulus heteroclitus]|uniref:claudin-8 n=1 Tax=Fundulus heteroclitus TaxID=8078 RepID=UPI00165CA359|nr:claudin-8 [Fundulus heteroclitus]